MQNKVRVYSHKRYIEDTLTKSGETEHLHIWSIEYEESLPQGKENSEKNLVAWCQEM
jgi:hypothetical protein